MYLFLVSYPPLSVVRVFKHVNYNFAVDQRVEWQAERSVPDTARDKKNNIYNECCVSFAQF